MATWGNHVGPHGQSRGPPGAITWAPRGNHVGPLWQSRGPPGGGRGHMIVNDPYDREKWPESCNSWDNPISMILECFFSSTSWNCQLNFALSGFYTESVKLSCPVAYCSDFPLIFRSKYSDAYSMLLSPLERLLCLRIPMAVFSRAEIGLNHEGSQL